MIKLSGKDKKYFPKSTKNNTKKIHSECITLSILFGEVLHYI